MSFIFILMIFASLVQADDVDLETKLCQALPQYWFDYTQYDQICQTWERRSEISDMSRRDPTIFNEYWVKKSDTEILQSFKAEKTLAQFTAQNGYIRILVPIYASATHESDFYDKIRKNLGEIKRRWVGYRLQGHSSYLVWAEDFPQDAEPLILKIEAPEYKSKTNSYNGANAAAQALNMQKMLERLAQEQPNLSLAYYPEPLAITAHLDKQTYTFSVRTMPKKELWDLPDVKFFPLHGLLGSHHPAQFAREAGKRPREWYKVTFAKQFGKFLGYHFFVTGIWPIMHAQNAGVAANMRDGSIPQFFMKDLADMYVNPLVWSLNGYSLQIPSKNTPLIISKDRVEGDASFNDPIVMVERYILQAVTGNFWGDTWGANSVSVFAEGIMEEAGIKAEELSESSQKLLKDLPKDTSNKEVTAEYGKLEVTGLHAEFHKLFENIYEVSMRKLLIRKLLVLEQEHELVDIPKLKKKFYEKISKDQIQWVRPRSRGVFLKMNRTEADRLLYFETAQGIVVYDRIEMQPLGLALSYSRDCEGQLIN